MTIEEVKANGGINFKNWKKRRVHIVVTYDCNMKCGFCVNYKLGQKKKGFVKVSDVADLLNYLKYVEKIEEAIIVLLGGEPTLLPIDDLKEIANLSHNIGYETEIYTNGTLKERLLELDGYIDYITISNYSDDLLPFGNLECLYNFKYSTITISKLITKQEFPTFEKFDAFVDEANKLPFNYDFSVLKIHTPDYELFHPEWVDQEFILLCERQDMNGYIGTALYKGRVVKMPPLSQKAAQDNIVYKLYPNGNLTTTWKHDNPEIDYKKEISKVLIKK